MNELKERMMWDIVDTHHYMRNSFCNCCCCCWSYECDFHCHIKFFHIMKIYCPEQLKIISFLFIFILSDVPKLRLFYVNHIQSLNIFFTAVDAAHLLWVSGTCEGIFWWIWRRKKNWSFMKCLLSLNSNLEIKILVLRLKSKSWD